VVQVEEVFFEGGTNIVDASAKESKLAGGHSWPFKFVLTKEVTVESETKKGFRLLPSWTGRVTLAYIDYKIIVTSKRVL